MRILALEPYYGGSHRAFLDGWVQRSRHEWTLHTLPPNKWKWRMRHAAVTLAWDIESEVQGGAQWDALFCSDMLNLAEFVGLAPAAVSRLPRVAYFHENQITYPVQFAKEYDYHFGFSNMSTGLVADEAWFNSAYHQETFLDGLRDFLKRMPDHRPLDAVDRIRASSRIYYPGVDPVETAARRDGGPCTLLWAARWEFDKGPELFFDAISALARDGHDFALNIIGGGDEREVLPVFEQMRERFPDRINHWGYQPTRADYLDVLAASDVIVSTARHEFFGIGVIEAIKAGVYPLLPDALAYPEVMSAVDGDAGPFFYAGDGEDLAQRLAKLLDRYKDGDLWQGDPDRARRAVERFQWDQLIDGLDNGIERVAQNAIRE